MIDLREYRPLVPDRFASRYATPSGALPARYSPSDIYEEDQRMLEIVEAYTDFVKTAFSQVNLLQRLLKTNAYRKAIDMELSSARAIAFALTDETYLAALKRVAASLTQDEPLQAKISERLLGIAQNGARVDSAGISMVGPLTKLF